jgi:hypothetical protein
MAAHRALVRVRAQGGIQDAQIVTARKGPRHLAGAEDDVKEIEVTSDRNGVLSFSLSIRTKAPETTWTVMVIEEGASRPKHQHTDVTSTNGIGTYQGNVRFEQMRDVDAGQAAR